jgi:erythromycin esterase-like protein
MIRGRARGDALLCADTLTGEDASEACAMTNDAARIPLTATTLESSDDEVTRQRGWLNDLLSITALPALSIGGEPAQIVSTLQDALLRMLWPAFVFVRLTDPEGGPSGDMVRIGESLEGTTGAREMGEAIDSSRGGDRVRVTVRDAGVGVDRQNMDKLFNPFYFHSPRSRERPERLGLAFMKLRRLLLVITLAGLAIPLLAQQNESPADWIRSRAIRLTTAEAGHGFADLQPLERIVGDARIVSLGEATHGSREFFQLKHRMLEFLVSQMGFSIFSIEANMPEAYRLNDYVLNGTGDPAQLLRGMYFWTWDTEEVLAMIQWMRTFNQSGKGRVQFTGFDMQIPNVAAENVRTFVVKYEPAYLSSVIEATTVATRVPAAAGGSGSGAFGVATGSFPIARAAGKRVRYSGFIKTEGVTRGFAGLWWRVDGPSGVLAFDNMQTRGVTGSTDWMKYSVELPIDESVKNINFGALLPGDGNAWFDDLTIELDGEPYTETDGFDLGFESPSARGFFTGGQGYRVQLDTNVAHSGKQSLRMQYVGAGTSLSTAPAVTPSAAAAAWKDVVAHLESGRDGYRARGATGLDVDWAVQHARVVLQAMQMFASEVPRDRSMADNVKWILDHNPKAKIVLWAHNGHVATGGFPYETMGSALRRMYGREMVVFGFTFNQGSFQATAQGGGGLKNFAVPPAKADTLDSTLASARIPLFALDLRSAPAWFDQPRGSCQIGAMYPDGEPYAFVRNIVAKEAFDALLFVDTTTVARKNPNR